MVVAAMEVGMACVILMAVEVAVVVLCVNRRGQCHAGRKGGREKDVTWANSHAPTPCCAFV